MHPTKNQYLEHKELSSLKSLKKNPNRKWAKDIFTKDIQMANKHMKRC